MTSLMAQMRRSTGYERANAILARSLLAHLSSRLFTGGADEDDLHLRCVVFDCARDRDPLYPRVVEDVCDALAPAGAIEAVALCKYMFAAVVVFRCPAAAERALRLRGPARKSCHRVPPLHLGAELRVIHPTDIKIMSDTWIPEAASPGCGTAVAGAEWTPEPPPDGDAWAEYRDPSASADRRGQWTCPSAAAAVSILRRVVCARTEI